MVEEDMGTVSSKELQRAHVIRQVMAKPLSQIGRKRTFLLGLDTLLPSSGPVCHQKH